MRLLFSFCVGIIVLSPIFGYGQKANNVEGSTILADTLAKDTLIRVQAKMPKGFNFAYLLFIPSGTPIHKKLFLIVEPNNTGAVNDSIEVHERAARFIAARSSVGNFVSRQLKTPLLVPIFPRPHSDSNTYTHALDRDAILIKKGHLRRLDLQLMAMIADAGNELNKLNIQRMSKVFLNGFSASGTFVNRFTLLHPDIVEATASGGINAITMLPVKSVNSVALNYPLGTNDFKNIFGHLPDTVRYKKIPQLIYMGENDRNDAAQYDDAYSDVERNIIFKVLGENMFPERWNTCKSIYEKNGVNAKFQIFPNIGHGTNRKINMEVADFFRGIIQKSLLTDTNN